MPKILIVDDEETDRELARRCLSSIADLRVVDARNGEEALERIEEGVPDLILTDLRMPRVDGLDLVERLRPDDRSPPIVLMTSQGSERIAVRALHAGAANYVPKRVLRTELAGVVERVLEITEARRTRRRAVDHLVERDLHFTLPNDPSLISPLSAWFQDGLEHLGFATHSVRAQIGIAIMEAVANAIIHGNLEVTSDLRREDRSAYERQIEERRRQAPWSRRSVTIEATETVRTVKYVIEDQGKGFDHRKLPDSQDPENLLEIAGRGIYLIRTFMDKVTFNKAGNRITILKTDPARPAP